MQNLLIAVCAKLKVNKKLQRRTVSKLSAASCIENRRYYFVSRVNKLEHTKTKGNTQTKKKQKNKHTVWKASLLAGLAVKQHGLLSGSTHLGLSWKASSVASAWRISKTVSGGNPAWRTTNGNREPSPSIRFSPNFIYIAHLTMDSVHTILEKDALFHKRCESGSSAAVFFQYTIV